MINSFMNKGELGAITFLGILLDAWKEAVDLDYTSFTTSEDSDETDEAKTDSESESESESLNSDFYLSDSTLSSNDMLSVFALEEPAPPPSFVESNIITRDRQIRDSSGFRWDSSYLFSDFFVGRIERKK